MDPVTQRHDFVMVFDVTNGNPNGDPDAGNAPRIDPETGHGLISDVCLKRKIRNYITLARRQADGAPMPGYDIYVKEGAILNLQHQRAYDTPAVKDLPEGVDRVKAARRFMCQTFFDVRMFGAVMSTGVNCGQVRGPVQLTFARSVEPIVALEQSITRMAVTTEREAEEQAKKQEGQGRTMGRKQIVPYGLYLGHGFISPHLAEGTEFSQSDLELLWEALRGMFEIDRSAARGEMAMRRVVAFRHASKLGNAPAHALFERVRIGRGDAAAPARRYADYEVCVDTQGLPQGVEVLEVL
ncbi:MAG: type I-C CRISPR-associated protein Cas7/Csd2 [Candidatus Latescibacterota bacterium]